MSIWPVPRTTFDSSRCAASEAGATPFAMSLRCVNQTRPGYFFMRATGSAPP